MSKSIGRAMVVLIALASNQSWAVTVQTVHTFSADGSQGTRPRATLTVGQDRSLYGTASEGGNSGAGTAFRFNVVGGFSTLASFDAPTSGKFPVARLVSLPDGFLYGATKEGPGLSGSPSGTVFKLDPAGGAGAITPLFSLPGSGTAPKGPVSLVSVEPGVLHVLGTSPGGIWRVPLDGGTRTVPFQFPSSGDDGQFPSRIIRTTAGQIAGVTQGTSYVGTTPGRRGTIFRVSPDGSGFTTLMDCQEATGVAPVGALVEDGDGNLYGTTLSGGTNLDGTVFRISPVGVYTVLRHMDDVQPSGDLLLASDGKLYGTSSNGGTKLKGAIFRINRDGSGYQVLHNFNGPDGEFPHAGLVQADDGNLYGVTAEGGSSDNGTIFRVNLGLPTPQVNRPPVASSDEATTTGSPVNINVIANDFDVDGDGFVVTIEEQPTEGTAVVESDGTITYTPGPGYAGSDEFYYRITDPGGLFGIGSVEIDSDPVPTTLTPGVYNGLLNFDPSLSGSGELPRGQLIVNISATGRLTGKLITKKKRLTVRGVLTDENTAIAVVKIPGQGRCILFMAGNEGRFMRMVMFGKEIWSGYAELLGTPPPDTSESYTAVLNPNSLQPSGNGFAAMRFTSIGVMAAVGKLPDGTKLAFGSTLTGQGNDLTVPFFCEPTKGGVFAGYLQGTSAPDAYRYNGAGRWIRPAGGKATDPYFAGFNDTSSFYAEPFFPTARGVIPMDFGGDSMGDLVLVPTVTSSGADLDVTVAGATLAKTGDLKAFSVSRKTGIFAGKVKIDGKTVPFQGAILQFMNRGFGIYSVQKVPGRAELVNP